MTKPERLPSFFSDEPTAEKNSETVSDSKRMIELLEAIDWKLWQLYNMVKKGDVAVEQKVKSLDNTSSTSDKNKVEKL